MNQEVHASAHAKRDWPLQILIAAMSVLAALSLLRIVQKTGSQPGGMDFHSYWLGGLNLRQGREPFRAGLHKRTPRPPIEFLDGTVIAEDPVAQRGMPRMVPNTAALALVLFQFSFLSWTLAKWLWAICNLALALVIPHLVWRVFPAGDQFDPRERWLLALAFYGFVSTRVAVWLGQTTLVVFALMLLTLLERRRRWWLAGLALGFALSKYSLSLPLLLLLIVTLRLRDLGAFGVAGLVQLLGLVVVGTASGVSPVQVAQSHWRVFRNATGAMGTWGVQLTTLVDAQAETLVGIALAIFVGVVLVLSVLWRKWLRKGDDPRLAEYHLFCILVLLTLVVTYHRIYDVLVAVIVVPLMWFAMRRPGVWRLSPWQGRLVGLIAPLLVTSLLVPGEIVTELLPLSQLASWTRWVELGTTGSLVLGLIAVAWLLIRFGRSTGAPACQEE